MTYIIVGILALVQWAVSWFPPMSQYSFDTFTLVIQGLNEWVDIPSLVAIISIILGIYATMGVVMLANWVIKRFRGG